MKYKALITDVDGTLVYTEKSKLPSEKVTKAIQKANSKIHIGIASARPLFLVSHIFDHLNISGPSIIDGGSQIVDSKNKTTLWEQLLLKKDIHQVAEILKNINIPFFIHDSGKDLDYTSDYIPVKPYNICTLRLSDEDADKTIKSVTHIPTIAAHKFHWQSGKMGVTITHALATKQHAVFEVAKLLGITSDEIIGVGDSNNDFPLLMSCGLKVAMGNAIPDLKEIADYVAPSVSEDGLADVIEKFVLKS